MIKRIIVSLLLVFSVTSAGLAVSPAVSAAPVAGGGCSAGFLTFPAWYRGLLRSDCELKSPGDFAGADTSVQLTKYFGVIGLNVLEIMIQLVAYISAGFIIYGGYRYMVSAGDSSGVTAGKATITNAVIGLVLSLGAVMVISYVAGKIGAA